MIYIYVHAYSEIVDKFVLDIEDGVFEKLKDYYYFYRKKYEGAQEFCFDVMFL